MKTLRILLSILSLLALTACGGGGSSSASTTNNSATVAGVDTPAQVSVVTAQ